MTVKNPWAAVVSSGCRHTLIVRPKSVCAYSVHGYCCVGVRTGPVGTRAPAHMGNAGIKVLSKTVKIRTDVAFGRINHVAWRYGSNVIITKVGDAYAITAGKVVVVDVKVEPAAIWIQNHVNFCSAGKAVVCRQPLGGPYKVTVRVFIRHGVVKVAI